MSEFQLFAVEDAGPRPLPVPPEATQFTDLYRGLPLGVYDALRTFDHNKFLYLNRHLARTERSMALLGWSYRLDPVSYTHLDFLVYGTLLALSVLLAVASLSVGFLISAAVRRAATAVGLALFLWLILVYFGDLGLMGTAAVVGLNVQQLLALALVNPLQVFKIAAVLNLRDNLEILGPAGIYAFRTYGGALWLIYGGAPAGPVYDAILHAIFLGFVFAMIFGHAPLIFPSVLGRPMAYLPAFYGPLVVLHASLILRIASDLLNIVPLRQWGSLLNGVALLLFLGFTGLALGRGRN